ncbi:POK18 protein, partial [Alcedo cyanopectus]|nr:POK18 protein [Ceyx cyanopectus]
SWLHLGMKVIESTVSPQPIQLNRDVKTLNDDQKLTGIINWVHPYSGITNQQLQPL